MPPNEALKVAVIIPALNEGEAIASLVEEILTQPVAGVIVVDNGSTDNTADEARRAGARVVTEPMRGFGYACAAGVAAAVSADVVVFIDGDKSSVPAEMPRLLDPIFAGEAELVLGSRLGGHIAPGAMPPHQRFGNWLASQIIRALYGVKLTDLGAYRAIRRDLLLALDMRGMTYAWPIEMIVKAAASQARIVEVPVSWLVRSSGRSKVGGTLKGTIIAGCFFLIVPWRYLFWRPSQGKGSE